MLTTRVVPCLLLRDRGLVKTRRFKDPKYLGDPVNIVRIFNDKEVDELVLLDITASTERRGPAWDVLSDIATEAFVPLCYGGGVRTLDDMKRLFALGMEKVSLNSYAAERPSFIREAADAFGSQSVIVSIDARKKMFGGYEVMTHAGTKGTGLDPVSFARLAEERGAGELLLTSIDRDGSMAGYDLTLVEAVSTAVGIPVVACGGAGSVQDLVSAVREAGASAAAAGSLFVFKGPHRAVLISYPDAVELRRMFGELEHAS
jgi:cyclase